MTRFVSDLELGPEIGTGFFGVVHEGRDPVHGRVAVKIPRPYPGEPDADWLLRRATLQKEGQNLSRAAHPNIVKVHHLVQSTADDDLHLVMEFCAGGSLQGRYEQGPMPLNEVRQRSTEVALGLQALHSAAPPMLHRDIKPGNVLIDSRGITRLGDGG